MKLLILDDQVTYINALQRALGRQFETVGFSNMGEAINNVTKDISIALIDICLSQMDEGNREGLDFIHWLRGKRPDIHIIAMSARDEPDIPQRAIRAGADKFLPKPLRISELKNILANYVEISK